MNKQIISIALLIFFFLTLISCTNKVKKLQVGSKLFTESVILGEIMTQLIGKNKAHHKKGLGGSRILWNSLINREIDFYPEYTGTIKKEILAGLNIKNDREMQSALLKFGVLSTKPLGFNNTYVLGMKEKTAEKYNIKTISDLRKALELKFGFSNEFMDRKDGWTSLKRKYQLPHKNVKGLDHNLAYRGLEENSFQVTDLYSTDAEIDYYKIRPLKDDLHYFPAYYAVILYRKEFADENPRLIKRLKRLEGKIPNSLMIAMNKKVKIDHVSDGEVASRFLSKHFSIKSNIQIETWVDRFIKNTIDHLTLVILSMIAAIVLSIPLGVLSYKYKVVGQIVLAIVSVANTLPSLALLVFMIPMFGTGALSAMIALFIYSLLPIVKNTYLGLEGIPSHIKESAEVLGLSPAAKLRIIELPLASRSILTGIKTATIINIGTATIGALIGAGGYGQPILTGIRLDDTSLILEGAIPAAGLALLTQGLFLLADKLIIPKGLRLKINN